MSVFRRACRLDIFDLTPLYDEHVDLLAHPPNALPRPGVLTRIIAFFWHLIDALIHIKAITPPRPTLQPQILFYAQTINQRNALQPVSEQTPHGCLVGTYKLAPERLFPEFWAHVVALPFFPLVLIKLWRTQGYRRRTFRYIFDQYWLAYGYYITAIIWLKKLAPGALVVSNDHNMPCRALVQAAKELRIPTIYIQHASVTLKFPPLRFDYALLDGLDALEKYDQIGTSSTKVFLVGVPKLDSALAFANHHAKVQRIGICTNKLDPLQRVDDLCQHIRHTFPDIPLVLRPHPGDNRWPLWQDLAQRHQIDFSDARVQLSTDFLRTVDAVIVSSSNILLEATLLNVFPLYYDFTQQARDGYGFLRNGLTLYTSEPGELSAQLRALLAFKPDVQVRARRYCATLGTTYAGRSSVLALSLIHDIARGNPIQQERWRRIVACNLDAYELATDVTKEDAASYTTAVRK